MNITDKRYFDNIIDFTFIPRWHARLAGHVRT